MSVDQAAVRDERQPAGGPAWLTPPPDLNRLAPELWPRTAARRDSGEIEVGGVSLGDIAGQFGTPAAVFDEAEFRSRCAEFRSAFHDFDVYYAAKAFLCKATARLADEAGLGLDVCTLGELAVAQAVGFPADLIVLHGNNKSAEEIRQALEYGVGRIVADSFDEIRRIGQIAADTGCRPRILLRVTVGIRTSAHEHNATAHEDQKFGFSVLGGAAAEAVRLVLADERLELAGLHVHIGSQILGTRAYQEAAVKAVRLHAAVLAEHRAWLPYLSLGGGFGIAYTQADQPATTGQFAQILRDTARAECAALGMPLPRLAIEPGRAIAGPSGCTLYRVGTVKPVPGYRTYVAVDGGMSDNIRPALFGADYSVSLAGRVSDAAPALVRVVGKHCDAGDVIVRYAYLPADTRTGDLIAVPQTGAYCRSLSSNFNHTPRPPVVAVLGGEARLIVRRETVADLLCLDVG
jgi:diaminopimelate decarboxylase